jgi:nudix-type nucleoside diphosphatase (YffH/AdpP family)
MDTATITKTETLSDVKYTLKNFDYQLKTNDKTTDKKAEVYFRPDAVAVLLYNPERQTFLLTRQFRLPSYLNGNPSGYMIEACAGLIDDGESPEEAAKREVSEELGYQITELEKAGSAYSSVGGITEIVHLFMAKYAPEMKTGEGGGLEEESEDVEKLELSFEDARQKLKNAAFTDMKTVLLLQHYFLNKI